MTPTQMLGEEIACLSAHLDAAAHRLLECIRHFDEAGGWHEQGALSCAHWLAWRLGWDPATAREKVRVARALGKLPAVDAAFRSASLSYAKVRAITRVATAENEGRLLEMALVATAAQLERICRGCRAVLDAETETGPVREERSVQRRVLPGGMVRLELVLEPDEADLVMRAIECAREVPAEQAESVQHGEPRGEPAQQVEPPGEPAAEGAPAETWPSRADGAVRLAESYLAGHGARGTGGERFQVMIHLGQEALGSDGQWAATLEDGTPVSAEALRRVACDCGLVALGGEGENLNIGRRSRSIPPAIRRALMVRHRGCAFPGCTHTRFLQGHHVRHWLQGGETRLDNLALLCGFHHRLVHEGGWSISRGADGQLLFHSPWGPPIAQNPPREAVEDADGWMRAWAEEQGLELGPEVNMPEWDGSRPDYDLAVSWLLEGGGEQGPGRAAPAHESGAHPSGRGHAYPARARRQQRGNASGEGERSLSRCGPCGRC